MILCCRLQKQFLRLAGYYIVKYTVPHNGDSIKERVTKRISFSRLGI